MSWRNKKTTAKLKSNGKIKKSRQNKNVTERIKKLLQKKQKKKKQPRQNKKAVAKLKMQRQIKQT